MKVTMFWFFLNGKGGMWGGGGVPTRWARYYFEGGCEIAEHCRSDGDSCGMTGGRVVVAVGWVAVAMIEVPRLCGSEVVPPWLNLILEDLWIMRRDLWGNLSIIFSNEQPTVRQGLNYSLNNIVYLKWCNTLNMNIKVGLVGCDSTKLLNWKDLFFQNLSRKTISHS